jgi:pyridoxal phosphate enzyme (YggS family)
MSGILENLKRLQERIDQAARRSGRKGSEITLVAVTKNVTPDRILEAVKHGVTQIGENRVQEAENKFGQIPKEVKRHLVGHLQTNKVKRAVRLFDMIQSVDSLKLAQAIVDRSGDKAVPVLVEVNTSGEQSKYGVLPEETLNLLRQVTEMDRVQIQGLMTISPLTENQKLIRESFQTVRRLFREAEKIDSPNCRMKFLSMGMSSDFEIAIEEGSNMIRIGTAIFGARI